MAESIPERPQAVDRRTGRGGFQPFLGPHRLGKVVREILLSAAGLLIVFGFLEAGIRLVYLVRQASVEYVAMPYLVAGDYGPVPPWREDDGMRMYDSELYWRGIPGFERRYLNLFSPARTDADRRAVLRSFWPSIPESIRKNPVWEVRLNSEGFRGDDFRSPKSRSVFRIVCLGDSWTFGASVDQKDTYPAQLDALLRREFPGSEVQVLNLGIIGHSSFQGRKLMKRALQLEADVVVIGYAMNEDDWAGYREPGQARDEGEPWKPRMARLLEAAADYAGENVQLYRLLRYWAQRLSWAPDLFDQGMREFVQEVQSLEASASGAGAEPWLEASLRDYRSNLLRMIDDARARGAAVVLLFPEFWQGSPYLKTMRSVAAEKSVPVVDVPAVIGDAETRFQQELEARLQLGAVGDRDAGLAFEVDAAGTVEAVFRVDMGTHQVSTAVYVAGTESALADLAPNTVRMYDDGTHGDQRAADGVWSLATRLPIGTNVFYVYTDSGKPGKWEGLDLPVIRRFDMPKGGGLVRLPIDVFGRMPLRSDPWHTDASGNALIAAAVLDRLKNDDRFATHVRAGVRP